MNRGITRDIRALIVSGKVGSAFSPETVAKHLQEDLRRTSSALSRLAREGELKAIGTKYSRTYQTIESATPHVLENLLDAMAEAEPVLRKAIKIMRAVNEAS